MATKLGNRSPNTKRSLQMRNRNYEARKAARAEAQGLAGERSRLRRDWLDAKLRGENPGRLPSNADARRAMAAVKERG